MTLLRLSSGPLCLLLPLLNDGFTGTVPSLPPKYLTWLVLSPQLPSRLDQLGGWQDGNFLLSVGLEGLDTRALSC